MAAAAGRSLVLLLSRSGGGLAARSPGLGGSRHRPDRTVRQRFPAWPCQRVVFCSTSSPSDDVSVIYQNGLPVITFTLPSRKEQCRFTLKPISDTVGVFLQQVQAEDRGIDRVAIYSIDGERISSSTSIEVLLLDDFKLTINDRSYDVRPPKRDLLSHEDATTMNDLKTLVQQLYSSMRVEEHQLDKEQELCRRLEVLREQLDPLEQVRFQIARRAAKKTRWAQWGMLAYMSVQFGVFARLTWWEYSWDIMEPVTYFVTYGTGIAGCAYYILTGREYMYADASDRQFLHFFHKAAKKENFDVLEYNRLKDAIAQAELDLKRLRDPLQLHLPIQQIEDAKD
ncbi:calcium uniporter protein, mitochondrial [Rana temporaria]|uniref:calcium uniporter protein, mitochondrial n=1 Tax=Rana temporaria TaxID=8407 RepID=UPI001AACB8EF|nr:calcium uniporter protein, mitochondrial [Rana temporaria]